MMIRNVGGCGGFNIWEVWPDDEGNIRGYVIQHHNSRCVDAALFPTYDAARQFILGYHAKRQYLLG